MKRIVFVCVENANRSQMAEAFARLFGAGRVEAYSAGCRPAGTVHPKAIAAMQDADCLLAMIDDPTSHAGKIFDYLASGLPILALTPAGGEAAVVAWLMVSHFTESAGQGERSRPLPVPDWRDANPPGMLR